jgi:hypothetical protein
MLDLALFEPTEKLALRRKAGAYASFKKTSLWRQHYDFELQRQHCKNL